MKQSRAATAVSALGLTVCLSVALSALAGCVVVPDQSHNVGGVVLVAPPPPPDEVIGAAPASGQVWFGGYWSWVGGHYEWVPGHFAPGRAGHHWAAPHWVRQGDGWRLQPGRWVRD